MRENHPTTLSTTKPIATPSTTPMTIASRGSWPSHCAATSPMPAEYSAHMTAAIAATTMNRLRGYRSAPAVMLTATRPIGT